MGSVAAKRALRIVGGFALLFVGTVLLVLPGPGWAMIFLGLVLLATEFAWAHHLLQRLKKTAIGLKSRVTNRSGRSA